MRVIIGIVMMIGGICGAVIGLLGSIVVSSSFEFIDGLELTVAIAVLSFVVFLGGIASMFVSKE